MGLFRNLFNPSHSKISKVTTSKVQESNLSVGDLILLYWQDTSSLDEFPAYFEYDYHINPQKHRNKLIELGFLSYQKSSRSLAKLKVTELKTLLREANLPVSGKKTILVQRILDNFKQLEDKIPISLCLTNKGVELLNKNTNVIKAHQDRYISPLEYVDYDQKFPYLNYNEIKLSILEKRIADNLNQNNFGTIRGDFHALGELYLDQKNFNTALRFFIQVTLIDCSGLGNHYNYLSKPIYQSPMTNSYMVTKLRNCAENCDLDEYNIAFENAKNELKSYHKKIFLTEKDFNFIRDHILIKNLDVIEEHLKKYSRYTFDYYT
ncbi:SAP domain-containing protein [Streptococcus salivarius]|uniref:SAP domain-containing protein n=1 Tax=Streptococcus salivarius TaxID=1304 RepID=UPI003218F056